MKISKFINENIPLCVFTLGFAIVGYMGYHAVRWIINKCQKTKKIDQVAQKHLIKSTDIQINDPPKSLVNRVGKTKGKNEIIPGVMKDYSNNHNEGNTCYKVAMMNLFRYHPENHNIEHLNTLQESLSNNTSGVIDMLMGKIDDYDTFPEGAMGDVEMLCNAYFGKLIENDEDKMKEMFGFFTVHKTSKCTGCGYGIYRGSGYKGINHIARMPSSKGAVQAFYTGNTLNMTPEIMSTYMHDTIGCSCLTVDKNIKPAGAKFSKYLLVRLPYVYPNEAYRTNIQDIIKPFKLNYGRWCYDMELVSITSGTPSHAYCYFKKDDKWLLINDGKVSLKDPPSAGNYTLALMKVNAGSV